MRKSPRNTVDPGRRAIGLHARDSFIHSRIHPGHAHLENWLGDLSPQVSDCPAVKGNTSRRARLGRPLAAAPPVR